MKVAQLLATIPDALPPEYAAELAKLQSEAPPMGWAFVKRRMRAELGADWQAKFAELRAQPAAAASLGQVHGARRIDGTPLACKLQYPDMQSAVEADLKQLQICCSRCTGAWSPRSTPPRSTRRSARASARSSITCARRSMSRSIATCWPDTDLDPRAAACGRSLSTGAAADARLARGRARLLRYKDAPLEHPQPARDRRCSPPGGFRSAASASSTAIRISAITRVFEEDGVPGGINLLDYGCIRIFPPRFVGGVVDLYHGLARRRRRRWSCTPMRPGASRSSTRELIDISQYLGALHLWAAARRPGAHASPTASSPANTAGARPSACTRR